MKHLFENAEKVPKNAEKWGVLDIHDLESWKMHGRKGIEHGTSGHKEICCKKQVGSDEEVCAKRSVGENSLNVVAMVLNPLQIMSQILPRK